MAVKLDPDLWRAASHRNQIQHLTAPFAAGAVDTRLDISDVGIIDLTTYPSELLREPLILITLATALGTSKLHVGGILNPGGPESMELNNLEFVSYTETGASLPLYLPPVDQDTRTVIGFTIAITLTEFANEMDSTGSPILPKALGQYIEVHLLQGIMGRMLYLLGAEKQRIRRQAREIVSMRSLSLARDNALDRFGSDLGVPRFMDFLRFRKPEPGEEAAIFDRFKFNELRFGTGFTGEIITEPRREPDDEYRRRLAIYYSFLLPNKRQIVELLNGPGKTTDPNQGLLGELGVQQRFEIAEEDNDFGIAIHIVAAGDVRLRDNFLDYIRKTYLIFPNQNASTNQWHRDRPLRQIEKQQITALRTRISQSFDFSFDANTAIAPILAAALDLVGKCRKALGITTPWKVFRAQDSRTQADGGSSRYELGLGVEVEIPPPVQLEQMVTELANQSRPAATAEIEALLKAMVPPIASSDDPDGYWLLKPCGIQTCHRTKDNLYLSHLPFHGMEISGPASVNLGSPAQLAVRYNAPEDPGKNFVLLKGLETALASWIMAGNDPWTILSDATARVFWDRTENPRYVVNRILTAAGLTIRGSATTIVERMKLAVEDGGIPPELFETIQLPASLAQQILDGDEEISVDPLRQLVRLLRQNGMSAVLPLVAGTEIVLVVAVTGLPGVGLNISERRSTGFRWYIVPIYPGLDSRNGIPVSPVIIGATGSQTQLKSGRAGLFAVVAVGYNRRGLTDPYQFRVQATTTDTLLNLQQYEYLMNLLDHLHPLGIEIDTFAIRQHHVDIDGNGHAGPLSNSIAKTYRQFRRSRYRGYNISVLS